MEGLQQGIKYTLLLNGILVSVISPLMCLLGGNHWLWGWDEGVWLCSLRAVLQPLLCQWCPPQPRMQCDGQHDVTNVSWGRRSDNLGSVLCMWADWGQPLRPIYTQIWGSFPRMAGLSAELPRPFVLLYFVCRSSVVDHRCSRMPAAVDGIFTNLELHISSNLHWS